MESDKESKHSQSSDENQLDMVHQGQAHVRKLIFAPATAKVLKCATDLDIPDIIHSNDSPVCLSRIASRVDGLNEPSPGQLGCLYRVMWFLVGAKVLAAHRPSGSCGETLYSLTPTSELLVKGSPRRLAHLASLQVHELMLASWLCLSQYVKAGMIVDAMIEGHKEGFGRLNSLVDVSGGTGISIAKIVNAYPNIKGHVIALAEEHEGVSNVGGGMFASILSMGAVFIKNILHNWKDEECVNILGNCRRAIPDEFGKVIVVEIVLVNEDKGDYVDNEAGFLLDMALMVNFGSKERSEAKWKKMLEAGGFPRYNIIRLPSIADSIIEAFPM